MSSLKVVIVPRKQRRDNKCPLAIRITKNRKSKYIYLGYYIEEKHWNKDLQNVRKSHPKSRALNILIRKKLDEIDDILLDDQAKKKNLTLEQIKVSVSGGRENGGTFFQVAEDYLEELKDAKKFKQLSACTPRLKYFKEFLNGQDIRFEDVTVPLLTKFKLYLKVQRGASIRTTLNYLAFIRTVFGRAISEKHVEREYYPFGVGKIRIRFSESTKIGLDAEEVRKIETLDLKLGSGLWHTRNVWLFSFYLAGIRVSDVLTMKWSAITGNRLHYKMSKNEKPVSITIPEKAQQILDLYHINQLGLNDFIFPGLKKANVNDEKDIYRKTCTAVSRLNGYLKQIATLAGIEKKLTNHISRHTFGNIARDRIPIKVLQHLYRHSSVTTTIGYQNNFITEEADTALQTVIDL